MQTLRNAFHRLGALVAVSLAFSAAPLSHAAAPFEGTIAMRMAEGRQTHEVTYATQGTKMRISMAAGDMGQVSAIVDLGERQILMLMPSQSMYLVMPFADQMDAALDKAGNATSKLTKTDETATILGYACTKYVYDDEEGPVEIWGTDQLGKFVALPKGNPMGGGKSAQPGWESAIQGDFFPMRMVATNKRGKERMRWEVTAVKPEKLAASLFTVPAGYQKFDMGGMMQGLMKGHN